MLYRIDYEHFLLHAIDYFTRKELISINYIIISGNIFNTDKMPTVTRQVSLYPSSELINKYLANKNLDLFKQEYFYELDNVDNIIYSNLIKPLINNHEPIFIICRIKENFIIDALIEFIHNKYKIDCIDLNKLFINGELSLIDYDQDKIKKVFKETEARVAKDWINMQKETKEGRKQLIKSMSDKVKAKLIKKLGYNTNKISKSEYDDILTNDWVNE